VKESFSRVFQTVPLPKSYFKIIITLPFVYLYLLVFSTVKKKDSSFQAARRLQRKLALQAGFYDGRFKEKVIKDKKKEQKKKWARKKKKDLNEE